MLYNKRKYKEPRKDRSPLEIEYEKSKPECTFKPKLYYDENSFSM